MENIKNRWKFAVIFFLIVQSSNLLSVWWIKNFIPLTSKKNLKKEKKSEYIPRKEFKLQKVLSLLPGHVDDQGLGQSNVFLILKEIEKERLDESLLYKSFWKLISKKALSLEREKAMLLIDNVTKKTKTKKIIYFLKKSNFFYAIMKTNNENYSLCFLQPSFRTERDGNITSISLFQKYRSVIKKLDQPKKQIQKMIFKSQKNNKLCNVQVVTSDHFDRS